MTSFGFATPTVPGQLQGDLYSRKITATVVSDQDDLGSGGAVEPGIVGRAVRPRWRGLLDHRGIIMTSIYEGIAAYFFMWLSVGIASSGVYGPGFEAIGCGFAYAAVSFWFGGAVINPYLSLTKTIAGQLHPLYFLAHLVSQFVGAILAAVTVRYGGNVSLLNAVPHLVAGPQWAGFIWQMIGFYIICFGVMTAVYRNWNPIRSILVGLAFVPLHMTVGPYTTASVDPYRALVTMIFAGFNLECWIFFVGPLVGAITAGVLVRIVHLDHVHVKTPFGVAITKDR